MKLIKILLALALLSNFTAGFAQEDMEDDQEVWIEDTAEATPYPDEMPSEEMPVYDEQSDY